MSRPSPPFALASPAATVLGLAFLSTLALASTLLLILAGQRVAQRPAHQGVMSFHLGRGGELRLWNQPIRQQDLPFLLERARSRSRGAAPVVVRLIPDPQVPWGVVHQLLGRLRPASGPNGWILQLQLP